MPTTVYKGYSVPTPGTESGTWGADLNANTFAVIDANLGGIITKTLSNVNIALTPVEAQNGIIRLVGALTADVTVTIPTNGIYAVQNATTGSFQVFIYQGTVGGAPPIPSLLSTVVHIDSVNGAFIAGARTPTVGMLAYFVGTTIPSGWLLADGSLVSRTAYAALWAYAQNSGNIQTDANWSASSMYGAFSSGDGLTNFRIPDLRGVFIRPWASSAVHDAGRVAGQYQGSVVQNHTHPITITDNHFHYSFNINAVNGAGGSLTTTNYPIREVGIPNYLTNYSIWGSTTVPTLGKTSPSQTPPTATSSDNTGGSATDNRPENFAEMLCISTR
jgi:microcystin-dependent protein